MAFGTGTFQSVGGAVSDLLSSQATGSALRLKAQGSDVEGINYTEAAALAGQNAEFTRQSTDVKQAMADRAIYKGMGATQVGISGSGFTNSGSALDLLRMGASEGALQHQLIGQQGLITEEGYKVQQQSFTRLAAYSHMAADAQRDAGDTAERNGYINSGIKAATAIASIFL